MLCLIRLLRPFSRPQGKGERSVHYRFHASYWCGVPPQRWDGLRRTVPPAHPRIHADRVYSSKKLPLPPADFVVLTTTQDEASGTSVEVGNPSNTGGLSPACETKGSNLLLPPSMPLEDFRPLLSTITPLLCALSGVSPFFPPFGRGKRLSRLLPDTFRPAPPPRPNNELSRLGYIGRRSSPLPHVVTNFYKEHQGVFFLPHLGVCVWT